MNVQDETKLIWFTLRTAPNWYQIIDGTELQIILVLCLNTDCVTMVQTDFGVTWAVQLSHFLNLKFHNWFC